MPTIADEVRIAAATLADRVTGLSQPSLRIGVTGLSRAGKTVFITAFVNALVGGGRFPMFDARASGRLARARIVPQPDDDVPRFEAERHLAALVDDRRWPDSTRSVSQLRVLVEFESGQAWFNKRRSIAIDLVDYPGEWLLDLLLLDRDFVAFSDDAATLAALPSRAPLATEWLSLAADVKPDAPADEAVAARLHDAFTRYLQACRADARALSTLPPGRFLMPGDLEGSPALTFAPLPGTERSPARGTMADLLARRYEAYKAHVARPFFRDHFARLDRQVVLIDALQALNAGPEAVDDLGRALTEIMRCFRSGSVNPITKLFSRRVDRLLLAATKADHLHHTDHDRLQAIVAALVGDALDRAGASGADVETAALAGVRATREGRSGEGDDALPLIVGTPMEGETIDGRTFDGRTEIAVFPGDLPRDPHAALKEDQAGAIRFVRFRPPAIERDERGRPVLPHIRMDRVLEMLLGDKLL